MRHGDQGEKPVFQTYDLNHLRMLILTFIETTYWKASFSIKKQVVPFFQFPELVKTKIKREIYLAIWIWLSSLLMLLSF